MPDIFSLEPENPPYDVADELLSIVEKNTEYKRFIDDIYLDEDKPDLQEVRTKIKGKVNAIVDKYHRYSIGNERKIIDNKIDLNCDIIVADIARERFIEDQLPTLVMDNFHDNIQDIIKPIDIHTLNKEQIRNYLNIDQNEYIRACIGIITNGVLIQHNQAILGNYDMNTMKDHLILNATDMIYDNIISEIEKLISETVKIVLEEAKDIVLYQEDENLLRGKKENGENRFKFLMDLISDNVNDKIGYDKLEERTLSLKPDAIKQFDDAVYDNFNKFIGPLVVDELKYFDVNQKIKRVAEIDQIQNPLNFIQYNITIPAITYSSMGLAYSFVKNNFNYEAVPSIIRNVFAYSAVAYGIVGSVILGCEIVKNHDIKPTEDELKDCVNARENYSEVIGFG